MSRRSVKNVPPPPKAGFRIFVGSRVNVRGFACAGTVRFIGKHITKGSDRVGVVLDEPIGMNNGSVGGHKYFQCKPDHGVLVTPNKLNLIQKNQINDRLNLIQRNRRASANSGANGGSNFCFLAVKLPLILFLMFLAISSTLTYFVINDPTILRRLSYMNELRLTSPKDLTNLTKLGLDNARNIKITQKYQIGSSPMFELKGYHVVSSEFRSDPMQYGPTRENFFDNQLTLDKPVILYFHGNADSRGLGARMRHATKMANSFRANVLMFDLRSFGDVSGPSPTEEGVASDARAILEYVRGHQGIVRSRVFVYGHSLGAAVSTRLVYDSCFRNGPEKTERPKISGLILDSPFTNMVDAFVHHPIVTIQKTFWNLVNTHASMPDFESTVKKAVLDKWDNNAKLLRINMPVLILHGVSDWTIPHDASGGQRLAQNLADTLSGGSLRDLERVHYVYVRLFDAPATSWSEALWLNSHHFLPDQQDWAGVVSAFMELAALNHEFTTSCTPKKIQK